MTTADRVAAARAAAEAVVDEVLDLAARITDVPAPTGAEGARAAFVASRFKDAGIADVEVDEIDDVLATLPGDADGPLVLLAAHLDTVFPASTPIEVRRDADRLHGPGIGDNGLAVAALLCLPALLARMEVRPAAPIVLATNVGEEGLGNLRGMRAVMDRLPTVGAAIAVEGHNLGRVTHVAVGSRRYRITLRGPGGHSWGDFGKPSAIHAMARLIDELAALPLPERPKTSFNVGVVEGGLSVNTIAPAASFVLDLRSVDALELRRLATAVEDRAQAAAGGELTVEVDLLGERPAGELPADSRIVRIVRDVLATLGIAAVLDASSTDANIPLSRGVPAVCIGLTTGGNVHREDEYIDLAPVATGLAQLALTTLRVADELRHGTLPTLAVSASSSR